MEYCDWKTCASEGLYDPMDDVLWCDACGLPAVTMARVRLEKAIKRHDNDEVLAGYTATYTATYGAYDVRRRLEGKQP